MSDAADDLMTEGEYEENYGEHFDEDPNGYRFEVDGPDHWNPRLIRNEPCTRSTEHSWVDAKGKIWPIVEMTDVHVVNTVRYLIRTDNQDHQSFVSLVYEAGRRGLRF